MTDWKVRIPGRHAIGPLSTELMVRGIRAGRIPLDAEVTRVGEEGWGPLASVDEFYEAMELDDALTAFVQAPPQPPAPPVTGESDEDEETRLIDSRPEVVADDEDAVTRMVESRPELRADLDDDDAVTRMVESRPELLAGVDDRATTRRVDGRLEAIDDEDQLATRLIDSPTTGSSAADARARVRLTTDKATAMDLPAPRDRVGQSLATSRGADGRRRPSAEDRSPTGSGPRAPGPKLASSYAPAPSSIIASTAKLAARAASPGPGVAVRSQPRPEAMVPSPSTLPLLDADEEDETSVGSLDSKARRRFPSVRPLVRAAEARRALQGSPAAAVHLMDRPDERTAPALRLQRAYARARAALILIMAVLSLVVVALVVLLVAHR